MKQYIISLLTAGVIMTTTACDGKKDPPTPPVPPAPESQINGNNQAPTGYDGQGSTEWD